MTFSAADWNALLAKARTTRESLTRLWDALRPFEPVEMRDTVGNTYIVLATPLGKTTAPDAPGVPWSITITDDAWTAAPSSLLANDGLDFFHPFEPTVDDVPLSSAEPQPVPDEGARLWIRLEWTPGAGTLPVTVTSVTIVQTGLEDDAPVDNLSENFCHRPWATIPAKVDGVRGPTVYQTLGFAAFWLHLQVPEQPSISGSGSKSSSSSGSPSLSAHMRLADGSWVQWRMILRAEPVFRVRFTAPVLPGQQSITWPLPPQFVQLTRDRRVTAADCPGSAATVVPTLTATTVHAAIHRTRRRGVRSVAVEVEGTLSGWSGPDTVDDATAAANAAFWAGKTFPTP